MGRSSKSKSKSSKSGSGSSSRKSASKSASAGADSKSADAESADSKGKPESKKAQKKAAKKERKAAKKALRKEQNRASPIALLRLWPVQYIAAALTGTLLFLACADFDIWPLAWFGFLPVLLAARDVSPKRAFMLGWMAGLVGNAGGFYWITTLLVRFGHLPKAVAFVLFLLLVAYQGLHWGVFTWALRRLRLAGVDLPATLLAPIAMVAMELVMPFVFDWYLAITQAWVIPVIQVADLAGPLGTTALLMLANGVIYDVVSFLWLKDKGTEAAPAPPRAPWRAAAIGLAVLAAGIGYGYLRMSQIDAKRAKAKRVKIGVVQANIGILTKGRHYLAPRHHELHLRESIALQKAGAELIVWPESSYPFAMLRSRNIDWPKNDLRRIMQGIKVPVLFGAVSVTRNRDDYPWNTAYMMMPDGRITGRFDKNFLLIFGEYIPFYEKIPWFKKVIPAASHFNHGTEVTTFPFRDQKIGPMICYEDILPAFGRRLAKLHPNLLINITNDAWFGATSEPWEHLALSVFRAVELRLDLVRAVNTGVSAFIDAAGRVVKHTKSYDPVITPGVPPTRLLGESVFLDGGRTVYAAVGNLFGYLCLATLLGLGFLAWRRRKNHVRPRS